METISQQQIEHLEQLISQCVVDQGYYKDQYEDAFAHIEEWLCDWLGCSIDEITEEQYEKALGLLKSYPRKG